MNIPTPKAGYWSKIRNGKKVKQSPLPKFDQTTFDLYLNKRTNVDISAKLPKPQKTIKVKKHLQNLHPLTKATYDRVKDSWRNQFNRVQPIGSGYLDISVNPDSLKRTIRILEAVVKETARQGFHIGTDRLNRSSKSYIKVGEEKVYFQIREEGYRKKRKPDPSEKHQRWSYHEYEYITNGRLKLFICESIYASNKRSIADTNSRVLEERLDEFFPLVFEMAEKIKIDRLEREERHRRWEEERRLREQAERQHREEIERLEVLESQAEIFTKSQYIYDFIARIEQIGNKLDLTEREKLMFKGWFQWTSIHANRLNPVNQAIDSILENEQDKF